MIKVKMKPIYKGRRFNSVIIDDDVVSDDKTMSRKELSAILLRILKADHAFKVKMDAAAYKYLYAVKK